ncbi:GNAT family N-acetyltransferase [Ilumatobacter nonamiensis]|uniref:GNAT family N-acetyltransferase n=1 Tax=Ilumatobacter nonamiensis TaxID=467093 RepID=UPI000346CA3E|nr:GNAT family N-acetyltransferase [Ilumatobacter nonamiensis]
MVLPDVAEFPSSEWVELRIPDEDDVGLVLDASTATLIPLITTIPANCTVRQAREFIRRQQDRPRAGRGWSLTIVDRATGDAVGNLFVSCNSLELGAIEVGYWVAPSHRGRGHAANALRAAREWAVADLGADRLTSYIDPDNAPSLRTAQRAGLEQETTYDRWERVGDEFRPMTVWSYGPGRPEPGHIGPLESRMWLNDYRGDARWFDHHLHADFVEHGCSGALWTRDRIVNTRVDEEIMIRLPLADQCLQQLASDTWMLTYIAHQPDRSCRRVSIWQELSEGWRLRFHQGTPLP